MKDTSPEIERKVIELMREKTPEERVRMGFSMNETSRYLVTRAILEKNPGISKARLRQELFLRYYGDEYDDHEKEAILAHLERCT